MIKNKLSYLLSTNIKMPLPYDKPRLVELCRRDGATLIGEYASVNREIKPRFRCSCGKEEDKRTFRDMCNKGAFCHECIYTKASEKRNNTVKIVYGVECVSQIESVKAKRVETNMERRGVAVPFQAAEVKEKSKVTNLERYGAEHPLQNTIIMGNVIATNLERYGTTCSLQSDFAKEKSIITLQTKYGEHITNVFQAEEVKEKSKATNLERRGVEYPGQSEECKEKSRATNLERRGVEYAFQSEDVKEKSKATHLERLGVEHPLQSEEIMGKVKATNLERLGVEHPLQSEEIMGKVKATRLGKYGFEHVLQNPKIMERQQKKSFSFKDFVMPSGDVRKIQGYEAFALNELVKVYTEDQIITGTSNVPRILYTDNGKERYHYPDIWIPHDNKLIEVKSTKTYEWHKDEVLQKKKACEEQGYLYEIWCFDSKGHRVEVPV